LIFIRLEDTHNKIWNKDGIMRNTFIKSLHATIKKDLKHIS
jgi:hypothetical protein